MTIRVYCYKVSAPFKASVGGVINSFNNMHEAVQWCQEQNMINLPDSYKDSNTGAHYTFKLIED